MSFRTAWRVGGEIAVASLLFLATLATSAYFAPLGANNGFVDMSHDGYTLREAVDLDRGATLFKDTYEQYGTLGPYLNLIEFRLSGRRLLGLKYAICLWYAVIAVLLYVLARQFLDPVLSTVTGLLWLFLAPFYQHGIMISVHVYVLFFQAAAMLALLAYLKRPSSSWLALAGVCCGFSCILKQSVGFLFAVGIGLYFVSRVLRRQSTLRAAALELTVFSVPAVGVIAVALGLMWRQGALHDWYLQTILFPRQFYLVVGDGSGYSASLWTFPLRFIHAQIREGVALYWYVMRAILAVGIYFTVRKAAPAPGDERLVLVGLVALVLWAAAYPSAHYMHQWWTLGLGFAAVVHWVKAAAEWALERVQLNIRFARAVTIALIFVLVRPGIEDRVNAAEVRTFTQPEVITAPWVISGIRTDYETRNDLALLYSTVQDFRRTHPGTPLISVDSSDGWLHGVAESLLWLTMIDDNPHPHPVYWSMPVLSTDTYNDYRLRVGDAIRDSHPLVGESRIGEFTPQRVDGYYLRLAIRTPRTIWYLYAPQDPDPSASRPQTTLVRLTDRKRRRTRSQQFAQEIQGTNVTRREDRDVYLWPRDIDLPDTLPSALQPLTGAVTPFEKGARIDATGWALDGFVRAPYKYVLETQPEGRRRGDYFIARGELQTGGVTFGLQRGDKWIGYVNVTTPGPFIVLLQVPGNATYSLVVANCIELPWTERLAHPVQWLHGELFRNSFRVTSFGWSQDWE